MPEVNQPMFDHYSTAHAGFGVVFATAGLPLWAAAAISIVFELFENRLKDTFPAAFPFSSHDSLANTIGDTLSLLTSFVLARHAIDRGLSPAGEAGLQAIVQGTLAGFVGAVAAGGTSSLIQRTIGEQAANWGDQGFRVGAGLGGAYGVARVDGSDAAVILTPVGGYLGGPVGAGLVAYLVTRAVQ